MKIKLGLLREFLLEVSLSHEMDETDERMVGDNAGDTHDPNDPNDFDLSSHLRGTDEKLSLGDPDPMDEAETSALFHSIKEYFLQEAEGVEAPSGDDETPSPGSGAAVGSPSAGNSNGFYTPFDMDKDHSSTWYKSPGQGAGTAGDPFRGEDPYAQLGFHAPAGDKDPTASPPATDGEEGVAARLAPPIWQLSAGSDTSKVLGANAKADSGGVDSGNEPEAGEEGQGEEGESGDEGDEAEGSKSS